MAAKDPRVEQVWWDHHNAQITEQEGKFFRSRRDKTIRELRTKDPKFWTYSKLAAAVGCSKTLIQQVLERPQVLERGEAGEGSTRADQVSAVQSASQVDAKE